MTDLSPVLVAHPDLEHDGRPTQDRSRQKRHTRIFCLPMLTRLVGIMTKRWQPVVVLAVLATVTPACGTRLHEARVRKAQGSTSESVHQPGSETAAAGAPGPTG